MSYLPCELHCHTVHSDGDFLPTDLQRSARDNGLSLIALTDHNTSSGCDELDESMIPVIRGIEWTTYFGHMLVLGAEGFVDWRDALPNNIDEKIKQVKAMGGLVGIAHPFQLGSPMCTGGRWEFNVKNWNTVDYIEIWHEAFSKDNYENEKALSFWTSLLDMGYHLAASYGRDWHRPNLTGHFGCTYIDIDKSVSQENAKEAIKKGRTVVSAGAKFFFTVKQNNREYKIGDTLSAGEAEFNIYLDIYARAKQTECRQIVYNSIRLVTNGGDCVCESTINQSKMIALLEPNHWYRAELWGSFSEEKTILAVTSPVYVE